ncbi:tripartite tricarboxylate transporter substrate binding protein [Bradyrhizobium sp. 190]|uniref:Bug family tripartite tricarboxylate transporter substrate binding protein n=1 Tax=Bradyrhizobium sp. 190 TaxID=2782658 RepID=UPI001FFACC38|nr:tripartite tricarboxylate transporter substrate-binding protein [Bradyrhizobium sp. 190]MCK1517088.1 tripartite tricarboxylate transporter substrate binding protein [Bradyrhizobium sp. 190]
MLKPIHLSRRTFLAGSAAALLLASAARGQGPSLPKTITIHVGFPAGGPADTTARLIAEKLREITGSSVVVLNRPGAGGTLAAGAVAQMEPDGANLLLVSSGHAGAPALYPNLKFDSQRDFTPIVALAQSPVIILVRKDSLYRSIEDLMADMRAKPAVLKFATGGGGATLTSLGALLLRAQLGYDALAVAYRGSGPANIDLMGGIIDFSFDTVSGAIGLLQSGDVRGLAVTSKTRAAAIPNVPTIAETVKPDFDVTGWFGLLGPARMPAAVVTRLNEDLNRVVLAPEFRARLVTLGIDVMGGTPEAFGALIASETARWGKLIRDLGLQPQ